MIQPIHGVTIGPIVPTSIFQPNAPPVEGYNISFRTNHGVTTFVKVPRTPTWPDDAAAAIAEEYQRIDQLHQQFPSDSRPRG